MEIFQTMLSVLEGTATVLHIEEDIATSVTIAGTQFNTLKSLRQLLQETKV